MTKDQKDDLKRVADEDLKMVNRYTDGSGCTRVSGTLGLWGDDVHETSSLISLKKNKPTKIKLRSSGPSLKSSAHYPQGFAAFIADQHAKVLVAWKVKKHTIIV